MFLSIVEVVEAVRAETRYPWREIRHSLSLIWRI